ncbi:MAG: DUF5103 domain-containing protein [Bacteroidales bacterium]|nr:DUF5103 domain-containing protein [Bacteroidales bacterium]
MRNHFIFIVLLFFSINGRTQSVFSDQILNANIKTVELYPDNDRLGEPVIFLNEQIPLTLAFDELDSDYRLFAYTLIHCDAQWHISELSPNEYLEGYIEDYIEDYQFSLNTKVPYIHYSLQIPNEAIQFRYSGNYILKIYPENEEENPILTKKLYVVDPLCSINGEIIAPSNPELIKSAQEINFKVNISNLNSHFPSREISTQIQQNGRYDNQIDHLEPLSIKDGILDFNLQKGNVFQGLNTYRFFDFSSLDYNSEYIYAINKNGAIDEIELLLSKSRANKAYKNEPTQFGKFFIETKDYQDADIESEYAFVHFLYFSKSPLLNNDLYLLGSFDLWSLSHKLSYDYSSQVYETKLLLKQGYYSYLYALKNKNTKAVDVGALEGSFFQTPNNYTIRLYYRAPGTTYDQLVGYKQLKNYSD